MTILGDCRMALRVTSTVFDGEIAGLIETARQDLVTAGVSIARVYDDTDALAKRAVITYVKAHFGMDNPDHDRLVRSFDGLKAKLSIVGEYSS